jgi:ABC-type sulfate transport system permease component
MLGEVSFPRYALHSLGAVLSIGVSVYTGIVAAITALSLATLVALLGARRTQPVLKLRGGLGKLDSGISGFSA